ncbi:MAG TPA: UDP-glucose 4-epimerase GalE [Cyanobacteria bacterium UBA11149]|nr:UDP-glucose 4-epimerase GalE [Cyanobacteria bacterium UBA11367]HBE56528.1 UDP-glucose 4-epimerase GalE [Cyanobacteria bacterium UBA11366]HBK62378.1 UDP-glucose 4-epimerase GalE [Cyanobacteria bacterium UBA11166]HBR75683.1 UDP-glucose 4-epimerase GalE [Cyanobacteria bacterium UBA11159]HBS68613.1 UDP-glucose 4-epimerase GalE [Cyanobacteria bacterium UBA11153]HBW91334.1 UDP-glucose 4-epimerase GalE [Cyanobacteria bacterium UBA11149]HCA97768.1 UDP-glucose 4-epimerase GalE [Cyanobacteria bacter
MQVKPIILVTGGAGYIGSHTVLALLRAGYRVIVLDNLVSGHREFVTDILQVELVVGDICDRPMLDRLFAQYNIAAVLHFAAYIAVGESAIHPAKYYRNNVSGTLTLLEAMVAANVKKLVFPSTCAVYGMPKQIPMTEDHPQDPLNPYATSKWMMELMLADFDRAYNLRSVVFRFFNAAGANSEGLLGEDHHPETHLIPLALLTALGKRESISICGTDYPTPDGTCLRDYIHVSDLANAHILALEYLLAGGKSEVFNLGNGNGFSVREVIQTVQEITGKDLRIMECDRRPGDAPILVGTSDKVREILGWYAQYPDLSTIITDAWQWHQHRHG